MQLREIPEPALPADDWVVLRTRLCGVCGSDYKQVFLNGAFDNPMTAYDLVSAGARPRGGRRPSSASGPGWARRRVGERVVLNPWLSCATRGLAALRVVRARRPRAVPELPHAATSRPASTTATEPRHGRASRRCCPRTSRSASRSPTRSATTTAVLADPFSVSLHAILQPPPPAGRHGARLRRGHARPARDRDPARAPPERARARGGALRAPGAARREVRRASAVLRTCARARRDRRRWRSRRGAEIAQPWRGLPMLNGGVDVVYDTVSAPETLEVGLRVAKTRGRIVGHRRRGAAPLRVDAALLQGDRDRRLERLRRRGVSTAAASTRWSGTSSSCARRGIDVTPILTHRFALADWRNAFRTGHDQGRERRREDAVRLPRTRLIIR